MDLMNSTGDEQANEIRFQQKHQAILAAYLTLLFNEVPIRYGIGAVKYNDEIKSTETGYEAIPVQQGNTCVRMLAKHTVRSHGHVKVGSCLIEHVRKSCTKTEGWPGQAATMHSRQTRGHSKLGKLAQEVIGGIPTWHSQTSSVVVNARHDHE